MDILVLPRYILSSEEIQTQKLMQLYHIMETDMNCWMGFVIFIDIEALFLILSYLWYWEKGVREEGCFYDFENFPYRIFQYA